MESFVLDPAGDVTLVVGANSPRIADPWGAPVKTKHKIYTIHVCSNNLRQVSPVWRAMFAPGNWKESVTGHVEMPEDDATAMLLILRICHVQFSQIPDTPGHELIYQLAVLCDKYDCAQVVRPWLKQWMLPFNYGRMPYTKGSLLICWTFGKQTVLEEIMLQLVRSAEEVKQFGDEIVPFDVSAKIRAGRERAESLIHDRLQEIITQCVLTVRCKARTNVQSCHDIIVGSICRQLGSFISLGPTVTRHCYKPIGEVINAVLRLEIRNMNGHYSCQQSLARDLEALKDGLKRIANDKELEDHFAKQAARCGWADFWN